jgi:hypothetical protein
MDATRGLDTTQAPDLMSKTTKISQSETELTGSASHRATSAMVNGILLQMLLSYASFASTLLSDEHLDSAAGASPAAQ